jgi:hypothetical protein
VKIYGTISARPVFRHGEAVLAKQHRLWSVSPESDLSFLPFLCRRGDDFQAETAIPREIRVDAGNKQLRREVSSMATAQSRA